MLKCPECEKELKSKRAYAGHMWLSHQKRPGWKWELTTRVRQLEAELTQAKRELVTVSGNQAAMAQENVKLKQQVKQWQVVDENCPSCHMALLGIGNHDRKPMSNVEDEHGKKRHGTLFLCNL
jgi:uncharacterized C2H2 Zn-finger protein